MEKIKVNDVVGRFRGDEESFDLLPHAILESIGADPCMKQIMEGMKGEGDGKYMEVEFRINGQEVHFSRFLKHLGSEVQRLIGLEGQRQIEEKAKDLEDLVYRLKEEMIDLAHKRLGINLSDEEDREPTLIETSRAYFICKSCQVNTYTKWHDKTRLPKKLCVACFRRSKEGANDSVGKSG